MTNNPPIIADVFHHARLIEKWGRETNRVIEMCRNAGIRPPQSHEIAGSAVVKFHVPVGVTVQVTDQVTPQVARVLEAASSACSFAELRAAAGLKDRVQFLKTQMEPLLLAGWIERTIPDKPRISNQKYRPDGKGSPNISEERGRRAMKRDDNRHDAKSVKKGN